MAVNEWPPPDEFPDRLAKLRRVLGLGNQAIAEATGVGTETVSKWAGGQVPKGDKLVSLARFFGVTVEYLLDGTIRPGQAVRPTPSPPTTKTRLKGEPRAERARTKRRVKRPKVSGE